MARPRIVIIGGGFAGAYCALTLERHLPRDAADVLLLDRNNYFVFTPLLVEAGAGILEPRHTVVALRAFMRKTTFRMGEAQSIDLNARRIAYRLADSGTSCEASYDHLVLAVGSVTRFPDVPGLQEFGQSVKNLADAEDLRDRAVRLLEWADGVDDPDLRRSLLHFVVVGGNFTGVEVAGEFHAFLQEVSRRYPNVSRQDCGVTLVEIGDRILSVLDPDLSAFATKRLEERGIVIHLNMSVTKIERDAAILGTGERLSTHTVIWCAGIQPNPLIQGLGLPTAGRGYIMCERELRVVGHENVWAIGDCAHACDLQGNQYPATAQHAVREGNHCGRNLTRVIRGLRPQPSNIVSKGALAALGCRQGVAKVFGIKLSGFPAWFLWRTVYLLKMPGLARKIRVALDWTVDLLLPHEYAQLGVHYHPSQYGSPDR